MKYIFFCLILLSQNLLGQDYQASYLAGKSYMTAENYRMAQQSFQEVINDDAANPFRSYGAFYYGIASYRLGELSVAKNIWRQIEVKDPTWKNIDEVYYWLVKVNVESDQLAMALPYAERVRDTTIVKSINAMVETGLAQVEDLELLEEWFSQYPENELLAQRYANVLLSNPLTTETNEIIADINKKFSFTGELKEVKKDVYKVAVLLPFMYTSLEDMSMIVRNNFIMDIYAGMMLAADHLSEQGVKIELLPYDTRRSKTETSKLLALEEMKSMDLIVGPLYPGPFEVVNQFSKDNRINMINPLSGNSAIIADNSFSFLLKPTYETMAKVAAEYAKSTYLDDEDLIILYEDEDRFATMASVYDSVMTDAGYNVVQRLKLTKENSREILDALTSSEEVILTRAERDSLLLLPYRRVSDREPTDEEINDPEIPTDSLLFYEDRYDLGIDSIGHIFVASTNSLIAANAVGGVEVRGDRIPIVGLGEWLNFNVLTLEQFERLEVALIHTNYVNYDSTGVYAVEDQLTQLYRNQPSINQLTGYDLIWFTGQQLFEHGVYFQKGLREGNIIPGRIFPGYLYGFARDNQLVPIVKMVDSNLKIVNNPNE